MQFLWIIEAVSSWISLSKLSTPIFNYPFCYYAHSIYFLFTVHSLISQISKNPRRLLRQVLKQENISIFALALSPVLMILIIFPNICPLGPGNRRIPRRIFEHLHPSSTTFFEPLKQDSCSYSQMAEWQWKYSSSVPSEWLSHSCQPLTALCLDRLHTRLFSRSTPMASLFMFLIKKKSHLSEQPEVPMKLCPSCFLFAFHLTVLFSYSSAASPCCCHLLNLFFLAAQYSVCSYCTSSLLPQSKLLPQISFTYWYFPLPCHHFHILLEVSFSSGDLPINPSATPVICMLFPFISSVILKHISVFYPHF